MEIYDSTFERNTADAALIDAVSSSKMIFELS
jgi:hypothetical protein